MPMCTAVAQQEQRTQRPQAEEFPYDIIPKRASPARKMLLDHGTRRPGRELPTDLGWYTCIDGYHHSK